MGNGYKQFLHTHTHTHARARAHTHTMSNATLSHKPILTRKAHVNV